MYYVSAVTISLAAGALVAFARSITKSTGRWIRKLNAVRLSSSDEH